MKLFLSILCLFSLPLHAQNQVKVDSLMQLVQQDKVHDTIKVKAYNDLGIEYAPSNPVLARKYINNALHIAKSIKRERGIAGAYNCLGIVDYYQKEYESALLHFNKAYEINVQLEHLWGQAAALNQIGAVQNILNDQNAAIRSFKKAGEIFQTTKDSVAWAKSLQNIGVSYKRMRYHEKSIEYYLKALQLYEKMNNPEGIANSYINIGAILNIQQEHTKAIEYLDRALPITKETGNKRLLGEVYRKMGYAHNGLKDYDEALAYFQKSLDLNKNKNTKKVIVSVLSNIGVTYYNMKLYTEALAYQKEALQNYSVSNLGKALTLNATAKTLIKLNQIDEASDYAYEALEIATTLGKLKGQKEAYHTLAIIAEQQGENKEALHLYQKFQKFNDSVLSLENKQEVQKLRTIYEIEKSDLQIVSQQKDIVLLDNKNKTKNQLLLFGGIGLVSVFGFILLLWSRKNLKQKQRIQEQFSQNLISAREEERVGVARELHDSVGQKLMLLTKITRATKNDELEKLSFSSLEELRTVLRGLHPPAIKDLGITMAIESLVNEVDLHTDIFFTNDIENIDDILSTENALHLYRIIQESLNNIVKHANAKATFVSVDKTKKQILVEISDNGNGFNPTEKLKPNTHFGMKTLKERAKIINSKITIASKHNQGTKISLIIPI